MSALLKYNPNNAWLWDKLVTESKQYRAIVKEKQKLHLNNLFTQLETLHNNDSRDYMQLIQAIRTGNHDFVTRQMHRK